MSAEWDVLLGLFEGALERPAHERAAFLDEQTKNDPVLRREIESLLAAHAISGEFLSAPPLGLPVGRSDGRPEPHEGAPGPARFAPGSSLGVFAVVELLGAGGMGEVYRARDTRLGRQVAIKVLPSGGDTTPGARERFEREARAISRLSHPRICTVHDVGVAEMSGSAVPYLVMELLDGETLGARIGRGPLSIEQAMAYAIDIADGLIAAHQQGIVHRDLKPANVMLTSTGVKLLDFGLAQLGAAQPAGLGAVSASSVSGLTSGGLVMGTVPYTSPEQLRGDKVDARTDIFAFGALLFEMLTGIRPFKADSQAGLIAAVLEHDAPAVADRQPLAPASLDRLVRKCLAKNPDDRWQTARDLKSELIWVREGGGEASPIPASITAATRWPARRRLIVMGLPPTAALVLVVALWWTSPAPAPARPVTRLSLNLPPGITLHIPINGTSIAIAPDGSRIAFIGANDQNERSLFIHSLETGRTAPVPDTRGASHPMFSADSQWVAFGLRDIKKVPAGGGPVQTVGAAGGGGPLTWLSDGRFVRGNNSGQPLRQVVSDEHLPTKILDGEDGHVTPLTKILEGEDGHLTPLLIDDGALLFTSVRGGMLSSSSSISAVRPKPSDAIRPFWRRVRPVAHPDRVGEHIDVVPGATSPQLVGRNALAFARGRSLYAAGFDRGAIRLTGEPRAMGIDMQTTVLQAGPMYAVAGNGTLVYAQPPGGRRLVWIDRSGREEFVNAPERMYSQFRLSPDGTRVAAYLQDERGLWVIGLDGSFRLKVASGGMPVWSPDGRTIYFTTGQRTINRVPADGSTAAQPIFRQPPPDRLHATSITPDGKRLLTHWDESPVRPRMELRILELGPAPQLTAVVPEPGVQANGQLSPDGRWLVYSAAETLGADTHIVARPFPDAQGRKWPVSPGVGDQPLWSRDGREIFYRTKDGTVMSVPVLRGRTPLDLTLGKPIRVVTPVNTSGDGAGPTYDVSLDGQRFLFIRAPELGIRSLNVILNWDVEVSTAIGSTPVTTR